MCSSNTIKVSVTPEDIQNGVRGDDGRCMVALALKRLTGRDWRVGTYAASTDLGRCYCDRIQVMLPEEVEDLIERFDLGQPVQPFSFDFPFVLDQV